MLADLVESQQLLYLHKLHLNRNLLDGSASKHRTRYVSKPVQAALTIARCFPMKSTQCPFDDCSQIMDNDVRCAEGYVDTNRSKYSPRHSVSNVLETIRELP